MTAVPDTSSLSFRVQIHEHESDLGRWTDAVCLPHPGLSGHVSVIFHGEGAVHYRRDRILPRGQPHLLINLGPPQYLVAGDHRRLFSDLWFSGQQPSYLETEAPEGTRLIGVVFSSFGAYAALGMDQDELTGEVVDLSALLGDRVGDLRERLVNTSGVRERLAVVESWLLQRVERGRPPHAATRWAVDRISASGGQVKTRELARQSGYSEKHLIGLVRREVGLTPKHLARIHRFQGFLERLREQPDPSWSHLAVDCGYYDQSHLIREVRQFSGCTPGELAAARMADEVTVALD